MISGQDYGVAVMPAALAEALLLLPAGRPRRLPGIEAIQAGGRPRPLILANRSKARIISLIWSRSLRNSDRISARSMPLLDPLSPPVPAPSRYDFP